MAPERLNKDCFTPVHNIQMHRNFRIFRHIGIPETLQRDPERLLC